MFLEVLDFLESKKKYLEGSARVVSLHSRTYSNFSTDPAHGENVLNALISKGHWCQSGLRSRGFFDTNSTKERKVQQQNPTEKERRNTKRERLSCQTKGLASKAPPRPPTYKYSVPLLVHALDAVARVVREVCRPWHAQRHRRILWPVAQLRVLLQQQNSPRVSLSKDGKDRRLRPTPLKNLIIRVTPGLLVSLSGFRASQDGNNSEKRRENAGKNGRDMAY